MYGDAHTCPTVITMSTKMRPGKFIMIINMMLTVHFQFLNSISETDSGNQARHEWHLWMPSTSYTFTPSKSLLMPSA